MTGPTTAFGARGVPSGTARGATRGAAPQDPLDGALPAADYKAVFRRHPAGVAVVTLAAPEGFVGFTATSVISVSAAPPVLAFSILGSSSSWPALATADSVAVSLLGYRDIGLSQRFATSGIDRFAGTRCRVLDTGEPVLADALTWVRGVVLERFPVGESHLVTVAATHSGTGGPGEPLVYHDRGYHALGGHYDI